MHVDDALGEDNPEHYGKRRYTEYSCPARARDLALMHFDAICRLPGATPRRPARPAIFQSLFSFSFCFRVDVTYATLLQLGGGSAAGIYYLYSTLQSVPLGAHHAQSGPT